MLDVVLHGPLPLRDGMNTVVMAALGTTFMCLYGLLTLAIQPVTLSVRPYVGFAPLTVRALVRVSQYPGNRFACLMINGTMYFDDCWPLDGARAPITFTKWWMDLPSGTYRSQARVQRVEGVWYSTPVTILVLGEESP